MLLHALEEPNIDHDVLCHFQIFSYQAVLFQEHLDDIRVLIINEII